MADDKPVTVTVSDESGSGKRPQKGPRFNFFLIDSGWDGPVSQAVRNNIHMITRFQNNDPFFILNREQSTAVLRKHPHLIGSDPILIARDVHVRHQPQGKDYHGFHLNMGRIRDASKAVGILHTFLNFLAVHRDSQDIEKNVKEKLHREGLEGAIEVLRSTSESLI